MAIFKEKKLEIQKGLLYIIRSSGSDPINIVTEKSSDYLVKLRVKILPHEIYGNAEIDLLINTPKGFVFDDVQIFLQKGLLNYPGIVHGCSWHGHYEKDKSGIWKAPAISLKDSDNNHLLDIDGRRFKGFVRQKDVFAYPICRFHIPAGLNIGAVTNQSGLAAQVDFFILPEKVPFDKFKKLTIYKLYYEFADIFAFSPLSIGGGVDPAHKGMILPYGDSKITPFRINFPGRWWDGFVRCKYFKDPDIEYGVRFYATDNPIAYALDRGYSPPADGLMDEKDQPAKKQTLRELHRKELRDLGLLPARDTRDAA